MVFRKRDVPPLGFELPKTLQDDRRKLAKVKVPIVTISATFRHEIAEHRGERAKIFDEAVFSRAHFSMAVGVLEQALKMGLSAWFVDPTNYVSQKDWKKVAFAEWLGERAARNPWLKRIKDVVDTFVRSKLPITAAVTPPLEYVVSKVSKPIVSMHYESGNILARMGRKVLQVVTDPHVRVNYLLEAQRSNITFAVFDQETKREFLKKAKKMKKAVGGDRVFVTGPPVDPRIVEARRQKRAADVAKGSLRLVISTGGLGTNKGEIRSIIHELLDEVAEGKVQLLLYAGTHPDIAEIFSKVCEKCKIDSGALEDEESPVRVIYSPSIVEANNCLIKYGFPWAYGFIAKPSGDMAYDAVASGCFVLSLTPWGEWEENIEKRFEELGILQKAKPSQFSEQFADIISSGWAKSAVERALRIDPLFLNGAKKIVDLQQRLAYNE